MVEQCYTRQKTLINPIIDWDDSDVWTFIKSEGIPYCGLYEEGFHRIGCIGCPMARIHNRERQFARWTKYYEQYLRSFQKMLDVRRERGLGGTWGSEATPEDVMRWWMEDKNLDGQLSWLE